MTVVLHLLHFVLDRVTVKLAVNVQGSFGTWLLWDLGGLPCCDGPRLAMICKEPLDLLRQAEN